MLWHKKLWNWVINKKETKKEYPYRFAEVAISSIAKSKGTYDDFNKVIRIYEGGEVKDEYPYTPQLLEALQKVDEIPVIEEKFAEDEDFDFEPFEELGVAKYKK